MLQQTELTPGLYQSLLAAPPPGYVSSGNVLKTDTGLVVLRNSERATALRALYLEANGAANGYHSLYEKVKKKYIGISRNFVNAWLAKQELHQVNKRPVNVRRSATNAPYVFSRPNYRWSVDSIDLGSLANAQHGKGCQTGKQRYVLTIVDMYSRYAWALPYGRTSLAINAARRLRDVFDAEIKAGRGIPESILADNGSEFKAQFRALCIEYKIGAFIYTTSYTPNQNGITERFNGTLKRNLWKYFQLHPEEHSNYCSPSIYTGSLAKVVSQYNDTTHSTTGYPPSELHNPDCPSEIRELARDNIKKKALARLKVDPEAKALHKYDQVRLKDDMYMGRVFTVDAQVDLQHRLNKIGEVEYWIRLGEPPGGKRYHLPVKVSDLYLDNIDVGSYVHLANRKIDSKFRQSLQKAFLKSTATYWTKDMYQVTDKILPGTIGGEPVIEREYYYVSALDQKTLELTTPVMSDTSDTHPHAVPLRFYQSDLQLIDTDEARARSKLGEDEQKQITELSEQHEFKSELVPDEFPKNPAEPVDEPDEPAPVEPEDPITAEMPEEQEIVVEEEEVPLQRRTRSGGVAPAVAAVPVPKAKPAVSKPAKQSTYIVEQIIGEKVEKGHQYYLVKWEGYAEPTWESRRHMVQDVPELVKAYEKSKKS